MPGMHWQINDDEGVDDDIQYENNAVFSWHVMYHEDGTYIKGSSFRGLEIWNIHRSSKCENNMAKICFMPWPKMFEYKDASISQI